MAIQQTKQYEILWAPLAANDLESIVGYIQLESARIAVQKFRLILASVQNLETFPFQGRMVPELKNFFIGNYREIVVEVWRIIYSVDKTHVSILAVIDSRRNIDDILFGRLIDSP